MSIQKDVEQMYRDDMEKNKKNKKKKKRKRIGALIAVLVIAVIVLLLLNYLGLGLGMGKGSGKKDNSENTSSVSQVSEDSSKIAEEYIDIKVSGSTYIYQGQEITLDKFIETVKLMADNVVVNIVDDNGTKNAVSDLETALKNDGRAYVKKQVSENSSSDSDDSSKKE